MKASRKSPVNMRDIGHFAILAQKKCIFPHKSEKGKVEHVIFTKNEY